MAKVPSKGTVLSQGVAEVFTAVAQLTDISYSGAATETFECTTLDTEFAGKQYSQTGYSDVGEFSISGFFDAALQAGMLALISIPDESDWSITFSDATAWTYTVAGVSFDVTVAMADGVKFSSTQVVTDLVGW
jgi:hypothetical protein